MYQNDHQEKGEVLELATTRAHRQTISQRRALPTLALGVIARAPEPTAFESGARNLTKTIKLQVLRVRVRLGL